MKPQHTIDIDMSRSDLTRRVDIWAKCVGCGRVYKMTRDQKISAQHDRCATSPCCTMPATIDRVQSRLGHQTELK